MKLIIRKRRRLLFALASVFLLSGLLLSSCQSGETIKSTASQSSESTGAETVTEAVGTSSEEPSETVSPALTDVPYPTVDPVDLKGSYTLKLDSTKTYQTHQNFGGSGGWWAQDVGSWTGVGDDSNLPARERITQLLFDPVEGIGLTAYRYNLGAGSADSEEEAIGDPWRRAHALESSPGVYDWSRDEAAIWVLKEASRLGIEEVVVFANSAPERMKVNGRALDDDEKGGNFLPEYYDDFARYAVDVSSYFLKENIPVKYISPVNEPNWPWTGGQEGVKLSAKEVVGIYRAFVDEIESRPEISGIRLSGAESIFIDNSNKTYINAIMRVPEITAYMDHFASHAYNTTAEMKQVFGYWFRNAYPDYAYRLSEWTEMVNGRDTSMDSGLVLANAIYEDLSLLHAEAWQYWILVSKYDYHDGLIYVDADTQTLTQTKRLWVMGNYSRYIKQGDIRFDAHMDLSTGINVSAYKSPGEDRMVLVLVNNNNQSVMVRPDLPAWTDDMNGSFHVTSRTHNLEQLSLEIDNEWHLPPDSVVTVVIE